MDFDSLMPRDPFADDPNDPASFLDDELPPEPTAEERTQIREDIDFISQCKDALPPFGIHGICVACEDCDTIHYFDWDMVLANLRAALRQENPPVHEPGADPDVTAYVPWEYAMGYLDALHVMGRR